VLCLTSIAFPLVFYLYSESSDFESLYEFSGTFGEWRKATVSFVMSIYPSAWMNSAPTSRTFTKNVVLVDFSKISREYSSFFKI
jgi:hypothetical protein